MNINNKLVSIKKKSQKPTQVKILKAVSNGVNEIRQALSKVKVDQIAWETGKVDPNV